MDVAGGDDCACGADHTERLMIRRPLGAFCGLCRARAEDRFCAVASLVLFIQPHWHYPKEGHMAFPSDAQSQVIRHRGKPLVVVAGPGTGKTRTLVERMISLLSEDPSRDVRFITFTRASRRDVCSRLEGLFGEAVCEQSDVIFPKASTLHAYAKSITHRHATALGRRPDFSILCESTGEKSLVFKELACDVGMDTDVAGLSSAVLCLRCTGDWPDQCPLSESERLQAKHQLGKLLAFYNSFDMEGLVVAACEIVSNHTLPRPQVFLQVDEYQDLNPLDHRLVNLAASDPWSQVVVVADDAQSIYGFRYAHLQGVRELWESDDWDHIRLADCHRLPAHVLNAALAVMAGESYVGAAMNKKPNSGRRITTYQCTSSDLQVKVVACRIRQIMSHGTQEASYGDFLLLCPTGTLVDRVVTRLNDEFEIPAHKPTSSTITSEYWRLLLILRILNNEDALAFRQWLPIVGVTEGAITTSRRNAMLTGADLVGCWRTIRDPCVDSFFTQISRVRSAVDDVQRFLFALRAIHGVRTPDPFSEYLSTMYRDRSIRSFGPLIRHIYEEFGVIDTGEHILAEDKVLVATLHSAKGLEADYVFCLWMNSTFMPLNGRDVSEQKRLLYVALTRARKDLVITFNERFDADARRRLRERAMSPFLREIRQHLDVIRMRARDTR